MGSAGWPLANAPVAAVRRKLHMADVNVSHISNIENNRVKISLPTLVHVCNALDTTVDYVLFGEYENPTSVLETEILHEVHLCSPETQKQILKIIKALQ